MPVPFAGREQAGSRRESLLADRDPAPSRQPEEISKNLSRTDHLSQTYDHAVPTERPNAFAVAVWARSNGTMENYEPTMSFGPAVAAADVATNRGAESDIVAFLSEIARGRACLEFAVGTGRIAVPLATTGLGVDGVDLSPDMLTALHTRDGADSINAVHGDMTEVSFDRTYGLVYRVHNSLFNLLTQNGQVRCFQNAARHLDEPGCTAAAERCRVAEFREDPLTSNGDRHSPALLRGCGVILRRRDPTRGGNRSVAVGHGRDAVLLVHDASPCGRAGIRLVAAWDVPVFRRWSVRIRPGIRDRPDPRDGVTRGGARVSGRSRRVDRPEKRGRLGPER